MDFETYVTRTDRALLRYAVMLTGDVGLGQEVVQDVLFKAAKRWTKIGRLEEPNAYVRRMITNEIVSWHRKWGRIQLASDGQLDSTVSDPTDAIDRREAILRELARLPARQRAAVVLRYFERPLG